jgi:hypothetical protein
MDFTGKFVTRNYWKLREACIGGRELIQSYVAPADRRSLYPNKNFSTSWARRGHFLDPDSRFRTIFDYGLQLNSGPNFGVGFPIRLGVAYSRGASTSPPDKDRIVFNVKGCLEMSIAYAQMIECGFGRFNL